MLLQFFRSSFTCTNCLGLNGPYLTQGISVEFRNVLLCWERIDYITAFKGNHCWTLQIRKRCSWKRTFIHNGWLSFRDDLEVEVGDVILFRWKNETTRNFDIEVQKPIVHIS